MALPIVDEALRRAFPAGPVAHGTRFADLDPRQRRLVQALAASPRPWSWGGHPAFGNFSALVAAYGLPDSAPAMHAFAGRR